MIVALLVIVLCYELYLRYYRKIEIKENPLFELFLFCLPIILNMLDLWAKWKSGYAGYFAIGGLVPWSDANGYYYGARSLLEFGVLDEWSSRRPLAVGLFAVLSKITGQNLQITLVIMTILVSASIYCTCRVIYKIFGYTAGLLMAVLLCTFVRIFNATVTTEPLGFILGGLALAFLMEGFYFERPQSSYLGFFALGLAFSARTGALFLLPVLMLYAGYHFRGEAAFNFKVVLAALSATVIAILISLLLLAIIGAKDVTYQGSFSYVLYGLVKGGRGWTLVMQEHPEIFTPDVSDAQRSRLIYHLVGQEFLKAPQLFFKTILGLYSFAIKNAFTYLFSFIPMANRGVLKILLLLTFSVPLFVRSNFTKKKLTVFFACAVLGIIFSLPFLYDGGIRVQAPTAPFNCILLVSGLGFLINKASIGARKNKDLVRVNYKLHSLVMGAVVSVLLIGPILVKLTSPNPQFKNYSCEAGKKNIIFRITKGSVIQIVDDAQETNVPRVKISTYRTNSPLATNNLPGFGAIKVGEYLWGVFNLADRNTEYTYLIMNRDLEKIGKGFAVVCAEKIEGNKFGHSLYRGYLKEILNNQDLVK